MRSRSPRRAAVLVPRLVAGVLTVAGVVVLVLGLAQQSEPGGYLTSPAAGLSTTARAMTTTEVEVSTGRPADPALDVGDLARVRIRATGDDATPFFLGIAPTSDVRAYLRGVDHDEMASLDAEPPGMTFRRVPGGRAPAPPADQPWSAATLSRDGTATLEWDKRPGAWSAVAMPADGSAGLSLRADVGLRFPLLPLGAVLVAAGLLCAAASLTPAARAARRGRRTRSAGGSARWRPAARARARTTRSPGRRRTAG